MKIVCYLITILFSFILKQPAEACDLYLAPNTSSLDFSKNKPFQLVINEQYSYFGKLQNNGNKENNLLHQYLSSSITQLSFSYNLNNNLSVQTVLPLINRSFRHIIDSQAIKGNESGIGDLSILGKVNLIKHQSDKTLFSGELVFGLKFPTGKTDPLNEQEYHTEEGVHKEESTISEVSHAHSYDQHQEVISAVHGHDIALGTGALDYIIGANIYLKNSSYFSNVDLQYTLRNEGDFNYRFANDLHWNIGTGTFLLNNENTSIGLQLNLSGEHKGKDISRGNKENDTALTSLFIGSEFLFILGNHLNAKIGIDLPIFINNSGTQVVKNYQLQFSLNYLY